ncbi:unnamed protein product [Hapterophycus canaliculatus]
MGGTMGGVIQIFFNTGEAALSPSPSAVGDGGEEESGGGAAWCRAFVAGVTGVEFYGGATKGMRTVLDAVVPAAEVLSQKGPSGRSGLVWFVALSGCCAVLRAEEGAESTCNMEALAGRANYVAASSLKGVPDPGAKAAAYALKAVSVALSG